MTIETPHNLALDQLRADGDLPAKIRMAEDLDHGATTTYSLSLLYGHGIRVITGGLYLQDALALAYSVATVCQVAAHSIVVDVPEIVA